MNSSRWIGPILGILVSLFAACSAFATCLEALAGQSTAQAKPIDLAGLKTILSSNLTAHVPYVSQPLEQRANYFDDGPMKTVYFPSVEQQVKDGTVTDVAAYVATLSIPEEMRRFYDSTTGAFNYRPTRVNLLALENGDAPLDAVQVNWWKIGTVSTDELRDLRMAMEILTRLKLWIEAEPLEIPPLQYLIDRLPKEMRRRIQIIAQDGPSQVARGTLIWGQDAAKPLVEPNTSLIPLHDRGTDYSRAVKTLAGAGFIQLRDSMFDFEGGNIISGARNVFVGAHILSGVMFQFHISRDEALRALSAEYGRPVIEVGPIHPLGRRQMDFHIDLTMAVVRDRVTQEEVVLLDSGLEAFRLLLGDRNLAQMPADPQTLLRSLVQPRGCDPASNRLLTAAEKRLIGTLSRSLDTQRFFAREAGLQQVEAELQHQGYRVIRVPSLVAMGQGINFTNSIFSGPHAIMSMSGVRVWDDHVRTIMRDLGYSVLFMPVTQKSLDQQGGIRCLLQTFRGLITDGFCPLRPR